MASNYSANEKHEKCRKKVCIICYHKGDRNISQKEFDYIKLNVIYGLSSNNSDFPSGLCNGCQLLLNKQINGHDISLPKVESYDPGRPLILRDTLECTCKICTVANTSCFNVKKAKRGRPKSNPDGSDQREYLVVCSKCFSKIGKGFQHDCTRRGKVSNLNNLLASPVSAQRVASRVIANADSPFLATLGPNPLPIKSPPICSKRELFTINDMSLIQQDLGLSNKKVKRLAEDMRITSHRVLVL